MDSIWVLAVVLNPGATRPTLFRIRDGRAEQVPVKLGRLRHDLIVVHAQLAAGGLVVVSGHTCLADSDLVEVL